MGRLLKQANGQGHSSIISCWVASLVSGALGVALLLFLSNTMGYTATTSWWGMSRVTTYERNEAYYVLIVGAVLSGISAIVVGWLCHSRISRTAIYVHENGISGSSVVPKFPLSFILFGSLSSLQISDFSLTFNQISSVDVVNDKTIVIHATGVQHKIYAMNAREIRDKIIEQKNRI